MPTLIDHELFGYVKGAFPGANRNKDGLLASAEGGTVFLDEIGEMPLELQAKLLRALQEKEVRPVGATHRVPINCRILAATNRDLAVMVEQGRFLSRHDPELSDLTIDALRRDGVTLYEQTEIAQVENTVPGIVLTLRHTDGSSTRIAASHLVLAPGWQADHGALNPMAAGIETGAQGIVTDRRLRTTNRPV